MEGGGVSLLREHSLIMTSVPKFIFQKHSPYFWHLITILLVKTSWIRAGIFPFQQMLLGNAQLKQSLSRNLLDNDRQTKLERTCQVY